MNNEWFNFRGLGIAALIIVLLLGVVMGVQSITRGRLGLSSAGPYPAPEGADPVPATSLDPNGFLTATAEEGELWAKNNPTQEQVPTRWPTPHVTPFPIASAPIISTQCATAGPETLFYREGTKLMSIQPDGSPPKKVIDVKEKLGLYLAGDAVGVYNTDWIDVAGDRSQIALVLSSAPGPHVRGEPPVKLSIYILDLTSGDLRLLVEEGDQPNWSPDSRRIVYRSHGNLWVIDIEKGKNTKLYQADIENEHYVDKLSWSPDGKSLLFIDTVFRQETILKAVDEITGEVIFEVEHPAWFLYYPQWAPDGDQVWYVTSDGVAASSERFSNLWIVDSKGSKRRQVTQDINVFTQPQWSADGDWIAFSGPIGYERPESDYDLWIIDPSGSHLNRLTATENLSELSPFWSSDCTSLYFSTNYSVLKKMSLNTRVGEEILTAEGGIVIPD